MFAFVLPFLHNYPDLSSDDFLFLAAIILSAVVFITYLFVRNNNGNSIHYVSHERPRIPTVSLHTPFNFRVSQRNSSNQEVQCTFTSAKNCGIIILWGVPIYSLFEFLNQPWERLKSALDSPDQSPFFTKCTAKMDPMFLNAGGRLTKVFQYPIGPDGIRIGSRKTSGRLEYPMVALMMIVDSLDIREKFMIAMANAVHLPDATMKTKPYIIGKFLKPDTGGIGYLAKTYLSASETLDEDGKSVRLCTICYTNVVTLVLLPCCHACICDTCFKYCESCPICRRRATSYFELEK